MDAGGEDKGDAGVTLPADAETDAALAAAVEDSAKKGIEGEDDDEKAGDADKPVLTATALFQYTAANSVNNNYYLIYFLIIILF